MLGTISSSLAFTRNRSVMQIFGAIVRNVWDNWELRVTVLLSLIFQISLILVGNKRKHCTRASLRFTLWFAYLLADWLATMSLGVLSNKEGQNKDDHFVEPKSVIISLWAPLLLIHLGGSDTITAYSMEDNELWNRRFLSFIIQFVVAVYIFLRGWTNTDLNFLAIPIFIVGVVKMGERIWVLRSASSQQFKEYLFPEPDPGPNYARYMEAYNSASNEGFIVVPEDLIETPKVGDHTYAAAEGNIIPLPQIDTYEPENVTVAHKFLKTFKPLFADLILSFHDVNESRLSLQNADAKEVFKVMEIELGFMYDLFYTKAAVIYSFTGSLLRLVTLSCNISVLYVFFVMDKNQYPKVDMFITYVLLLGTTILEIYSVISMLSSDWTMLWLIRHKNKVTSLFMWAITSIQNKRWSGCIGQFNLISFCIKARKQRCCILHKILSLKVDQRCSILHKIWSLKIGLKYRKAFKTKAAKFCPIQVIIGIYQSYKKYKHSDINTMDDDLKKIIFNHFVEKIRQVNEAEDEDNKVAVAEKIKRLCDHRGDNELIERLNKLTRLDWTVDLQFDQSILVWHIATDLCYNIILGEDVDNGNGPNFREASKLLSEYMLYLLVMKPSMLPNGIGEIRFQDTCAEAIEFVNDRKSIKHEREACKMLLKVSSKIEKVLPSQVKGDKSKSVLFDACRLAIRTRELKNDEERGTTKMWKLITEVWVEMLAYAASHSQGIQHAQELRHGGELLTHVWLLMAHLGITDQFQITKGTARTKLIRK